MSWKNNIEWGEEGREEGGVGRGVWVRPHLPPKKVQYRPEGLQHLHARKMRVMWLFYTRITRKLRANYARVKNYTNFYAHSNYTQIARILMEAIIYSYSYTHSACIFHRAKLR